MDGNISQALDVLNLFKVDRIFYLVFGFAALYFSVKFIQNFAESLYERFPARRLMLLQIVTVIGFMIYIVGGSFIFYLTLQPTKELIYALGGSAAVAIGFSIKDLVASLIGGVMLLFDRPFKVGDRVSFDGFYGEVENIGLRAVRLTTLNDDVVTIPNSKFIAETVQSGNFGALDMMVCVEFHVSPAEDVSKVSEIIYETVVTSQYVYLKKNVTVCVSEKMFAGRTVLCFSSKAYVIDVRYEKAFETDIVTRVAEAFNKLGIKRAA
ncbi:MAG: mechanosensitive ion channel family protein [Alphaproteobacteria bacterium]